MPPTQSKPYFRQKTKIAEHDNASYLTYVTQVSGIATKSSKIAKNVVGIPILSVYFYDKSNMEQTNTLSGNLETRI